MALYITQGSTTTDYAWNDVITIYNRDTPNPHTQHRCAVATIQAPIIQDNVQIKTKQNARTITKAHIRRGREKTALNTEDGRKGLNSYRNNCTLGYTNGNNRQ